MKFYRVLSAAITVFSFAVALQAQTSQPAINSARQATKGIPFSADVVTETSRVLSDGTRIHQETHGKSFRDSEGRTRTETEAVSSIGNGEKFHHVTILDPVDHVIISLDPKAKVATIRQWIMPPTPPATPRATAAKRTLEPASVHEQLGMIDIEGLSAVGNKFTRTIEAGKIGNDRPIVNVSETWYSPDLKMVLRSKTDDPQFGERTMNLVNIQRVEPDSSLFQTPQDYTVRDERAKN